MMTQTVTFAVSTLLLLTCRIRSVSAQSNTSELAYHLFTYDAGTGERITSFSVTEGENIGPLSFAVVAFPFECTATTADPCLEGEPVDLPVDSVLSFTFTGGGWVDINVTESTASLSTSCHNRTSGGLVSYSTECSVQNAVSVSNITLNLFVAVDAASTSHAFEVDLDIGDSMIEVSGERHFFTLSYSTTVVRQPRLIAAPGYSDRISVTQGLGFDVKVIVSEVPTGGSYHVVSTGDLIGDAPIEAVSLAKPDAAAFTLTYLESGTFDLAFLFVRSDGVILRVAFEVFVDLTIPKAFVPSDAVECMARGLMKRQPVFTLYLDEARTVVAPYPITATVTLSKSNARYLYNDPEGGRYRRNSWSSLEGLENSTVESDTGRIEMEDLWIDRSGSYSITADVTVSGVSLSATESFDCYDPPGFLLPQAAEVNSRLSLVIRGTLPFGDAGVAVISGSPDCIGQNLTSPFYFPPEPSSYDELYNNTEEALLAGESGVMYPILIDEQHNVIGWLMFVDMYPYDSSTKSYVCLAPNSISNWWVQLWVYYEQKHEEEIPVIKSFHIEPGGICSPLQERDAIDYQTANPPLRWSGATTGRRYGCREDPPVNGSVPPCQCPARFVCKDHFAEQGGYFINVGICECCALWYLITIIFSGGVVFMGIGYFILFKL
ncbi:hypothetical protein DIPPA_00132 [Diplonema papillatum]|nr:hypothetical protein DIPPA_00132 [Diplonema papillatum]